MSDMFFCERLSCVLSVEACAKRWSLVKVTPSYLSCKGCDVGKEHSTLVPLNGLKKSK